MIGRGVGSQENRRRIRIGLALARAIFVFALVCWLVTQAGLQMRSMRQQGFGLKQAATIPAALPFVGVTVELEQVEPPQQQAALERLASNGVGWVRQRFDWAALEPSSGVFDWQASDAMIAAIDAAGLVPVVLLDGSPAWARADADLPPHDNAFAPPADPMAFANFAAAFAHRYGERVDFYQIWDEPNIAPHWGNRHIEPVHYAHLLLAAAGAIRDVDKDAVIIAAALAPTTDQGHTAIDEVTFLLRLYAAGIRSRVDAIAVNAYGFGRSASDSSQRRAILNFQRAGWVRRAMVDAGDGATAVLATAFGWNTRAASPWRTVGAEEQAAFLVDALQIGWQQWPWLAGLGWAIDQPAAPPDDPRWGFALDNGLLGTLAAWSTGQKPARNGAAFVLPWQLLLSLTAIALLLWRGWAALYILPWATWQRRQQQWPIWLQIGIWTGLIALYHLAVWPPLIALSLVLAAILIAMRPYVGIWLAAALLPFTFQHKAFYLVDQTLFITPAQAAVLAGLPALAMRVSSLGRQTVSSPGDRGSESRFSPLDWFALIWLLLGLLTSLNVWHWPGYLDGLVDLVLTPLLLYAMLRLLANERRHCVGAAFALFVGGVAVAVVGLMGWMSGGGTEADAMRRLVGPFFSPNHAALYLERTLFVGMGFWIAGMTAPATGSNTIRHNLWSRLLWIAALCLVATALVLTASRGALLLGVPAGLLLVLWLTGSGPDRFSRRTGRSAAIVLLALVLLGVALLAFAFWPRISNTATLSERVELWRVSLRLWRALPLLGTGPGGFYWRFPAFIPFGSPLDPDLRHPHNVWLEFGTLWGTLGFGWFVGLLVWAAKRVWVERGFLRSRAGNAIAIGLLAGLAAGLVHGQFDAFGALADIAAWNWLALGLWRTFVRIR